MRVTRKEIVAKVCYEVLYGLIYNLTYRDLEEEFLVSEVLRRALNLKEVPDYTTICKAVKRLREEDLRKLLEESSKLLGVKLEILAVDFTGLREEFLLVEYY